MAGVPTRISVTGEGPDVVLIPGAGASSASWLPLAPHLPGCRLHLVELPGFGSGAHFSWDQGDLCHYAVRLVDDLLDGLDASGAALVGSSFGGWLVLAWALERRPHDLPITVVGLAPGLQPAPVPIRTALRGLEAHGTTDGPLHSDLSARAGPSPQLFVEPELISPAYRDLERAFWGMPTTSRAWPSVLRAMLTDRGELDPVLDLSPALSEAPLGFTYAFGTEDPYLGALDPRPDAVPGAELIPISGGGHLPWFERPEALAGVIADGLSDDPAGLVSA